jgi:hypothetical protein
MLLSKGNILLNVHFVDDQVRITPVIGAYDNKDLLATFARNEELLTQLLFPISNATDTLVHLADYFRQRGWNVQH